MISKWIEKLFKFLASLKLAVFIIISIGILSAIGTFYEARYDAHYAQKIIYHSTAMYFVLALLCINLFHVMIDRWPWKAHHSGFIFAHVGIIVLILGSLVTRLYGIDGTLAIDIGDKNRFVTLPDTEFAIYSSFGTGGWQIMHRDRTDFLLKPPHKYPQSFQLGENKIDILDYYHYARFERSLVPSKDSKDGAALRIQLQNNNVNMSQWIKRDFKNAYDSLNLGPARVIMTESDFKYEGGNLIHFKPLGNREEFDYFIYTASKGGLTKKGRAKPGDSIDLGWMGLQMRILKYIPQAREITQFTRVDRPAGESTVSALKVAFNGEEHWLALNSNIRLFTDSKVFLLSFHNQRIDIGFDIQLKDFTVGRYQGTRRAASYASDVIAEGYGPAHISMNNPLKFNGFTFYQASFQEDETGKPIASILSVNKDPGRALKYIGSFLIVLGSIVMFYFKRYRVKIFGSSQ